jgi:hypothetical protein
MKNLTVKIEELFKQVAPELYAGPESRPVYVALTSDLPSSLAGTGCVCGLTSPFLDLVLKPMLERQGKWRGRGAGILISPRAIASLSKKRPRESRVRHLSLRILATALHELGHVLDPYFLDSVDDVQQASTENVAAYRVALEQFTPAKLLDGGFGLQYHGWQFLRACLHLGHRARTVGAAIEDIDVFAIHSYRLSPVYKYSTAIGDEPERLAESTFRQIWDTPPPKEFANLWRKDVLRLLLPVKTNQELKDKLASVGGATIFIPKERATL